MIEALIAEAPAPDKIVNKTIPRQPKEKARFFGKNFKKTIMLPATIAILYPDKTTI